jgi:hypothetical protein
VFRYLFFLIFYSGSALAQHKTENLGLQTPGFVIQETSSGHLVIPPYTRSCGELLVYFPGHAQEIGLKGSVPKQKRRAWVNQLLDSPAYELRSTIENAGCPVLILGDSQSTVSASDLEALLEKLGLSSLHLLSHSGGNVGLSSSVAAWPPSLLQKVNAVKLLDNFYSATLAKDLKNAFGTQKLEQICTGFVTAHNFERFEKSFQSLCPRVRRVTEPGAHKTWVKKYF